MGFSRQDHWSGLPFPSLGDLHDPGIKPESPALQVIFFFNLFIFGHAGSLLLCGLFSSCSEWRLLFIVVLGFLIALLLLLCSMGSRVHGLQLWPLLGSKVQVQ